jgi:hypothetical protein
MLTFEDFFVLKKVDNNKDIRTTNKVTYSPTYIIDQVLFLVK